MNEIITSDLVFPEGATDFERGIKWKKIAEISDEDFGFDTPKEKTGKFRFSVRVLMFNDKNEICVIKSEKYGYMQIPGGGIEKGESIEVALRRETLEETGWLISNIEPIGFTMESRGDVRNKHDWDKDFTYVFKASPEEQAETNYMEDEEAEGFKPIWIKLDEFIAKKEGRKGKIDNYSGCFSDRRDLLIARYYRDKNPK